MKKFKVGDLIKVKWVREYNKQVSLGSKEFVAEILSDEKSYCGGGVWDYFVENEEGHKRGKPGFTGWYIFEEDCESPTDDEILKYQLDRLGK